MRPFFNLTLMTLALTLVTGFSQLASASGSLKDNMKEAGTLFKAIGQTINDPSKNAENAAYSVQMAEYFRLTLTQAPEHMNEIPEAHRAEAFKMYQALIQKSVDHSLALQQAFLNNDNAAAITLYDEMKDLKQEGHDQFDP